MHDFQTKLKQGKQYEGQLDELFRGVFDIEEATREEDRKGIDRWFTNKQTKRRFPVQYKADEMAGKTGNAFIETISVDTHDIPGWAHTCQADYIVYLVVDWGTAYIIKPSVIREQLTRWQKQYPTRTSQNNGYRTHGVLVPLDEFEKHSETVVNL